MFKKALFIFKNDIKTIFINPVVFIVLVAIIIIPSFYALANIDAFWDPYGNTDNLKIAVVNQDLGYSTANRTFNVGNMVVNELKSNKNFHWEFVDYQEGYYGLDKEKYYGMIIIPPNFSKNIFSIESLNPNTSEITFINNNKMNPVGSRISSTGATLIQSKINEEITKIIDDIIFSKLYNIGEIAKENERKFYSLKSFLNDLNAKSGTIGSYLNVGKEEMGDVSKIWSIIYKNLPQIKKDSDILRSDYDNLYNQIHSNPQKALNTIHDMETRDKEIIETLSIADVFLKGLYNLTKDEKLKPIISDVEKDLAIAKELLIILEDIEKNIDDIAHNKGKFHKLKNLIDKLDNGVDDVYKNKETINTKIKNALKEINYANSNWPIVKKYIEEATNKINSIDYNKLTDLSNVNLTSIDNYFQSPVKLKENDLYPNHTYGEEIAPFYICLASWVGCIMATAVLSTRFRPNSRSLFYKNKYFKNRPINSQININNLDYISIYFGKMGFFLIISLFQSVVIMGGLLLLGLNASSEFLFILTTFYIGLCFMIFCYSLVSALGDLGKALAILLLVFQVPATGGTYAIQLLPKFFQSVYNFLHLTYAIGAIKEVIIGVYWSNYFFDIFILLLYPILGIIIVLLAKGKLDTIIRYMESKLNDTGLF